MNSAPAQEPVRIEGPAGALEAVLEDPAAGVAPRAFMVVCHPHPQHGGTMTNKVVTTLARTAHAMGVPSLRFNYRGVGASAGSFDDGRGEIEDALAVVAFGRQRWPDAQLWLAGFSFGGVVALRASTTRGVGQVAKLVTVAPALGRNFGSLREVSVPNCPWLIVQGDNDEVIDGELVIDWAEQLEPAPQLVVLPDTGHYFHGKLSLLQESVAPFLQA
ncbi:MAG TPA: alpha/beta hydrolase [Steroidobacteraceae bacterium]|nr:alpha/beta hydrolase [Steroidobacteraceae bacterium]